MNMKRPEGGIRQRSNDTFQIRYNLGTDPLTGKRKRISIFHKGTLESAKKELRRILKTLDDHQHVEPSKLRVSEFMTQWLDTIRSQVSPKTHERYDDIVNHFIIPALGACVLCKLEPSGIQQAYNTWEKTGRRDNKTGGLAPRTRLHIHRVLRQALKHAMRMRLINYNPADAVMPPRAKRPIIKTLTVEQSIFLLAALRKNHPRLYWPVLIALTTGMRRGEIVALRWKNVDFSNSTIRVVESVEQVKTNIRFKAPKTEKTRAVILPEYAVEQLKEWKEIQSKELIALEVKPTEDTFIYGRSWDGGVIKPDSLSAEFRKAIREIPDFPIVRLHDLRHSHATQLLAEGIHPKIAQERLGHSTITTTMDLYSHASETMQNDAASKLDSAFRSAIKANPKLTPKLG